MQAFKRVSIKHVSLCLAASAAFACAATGWAADDPAAAMAELGKELAMENPEGGGSIRAKEDPDTSATQRKNDKKNLQARVVSVRKGVFPQVALVLKVQKVADEGPNKDKVKKEDKIIVLPQYKFSGKNVDLGDSSTTLNAGAYYLAPQDVVYVRLDAQEGRLWKAGYIERR